MYHKSYSPPFHGRETLKLFCKGSTKVTNYIYIDREFIHWIDYDSFCANAQVTQSNSGSHIYGLRVRL